MAVLFWLLFFFSIALSVIISQVTDVEKLLPAMEDELKEKYSSLLTGATELCTRCSTLPCSGISKLTKQCQSELAFLHRVSTL